jgi:hypothetical protein
MREYDLHPKRRRRYVATTESNHGAPIFPNLVRGMGVRAKPALGGRPHLHRDRHRLRLLAANPRCLVRIPVKVISHSGRR